MFQAAKSYSNCKHFLSQTVTLQCVTQVRHKSNLPARTLGDGPGFGGWRWYHCLTHAGVRFEKTLPVLPEQQERAGIFTLTIRNIRYTLLRKVDDVHYRTVRTLNEEQVVFPCRLKGSERRRLGRDYTHQSLQILYSQRKINFR